METHWTVGIIAEKNGKVLLVTRLNEPNKGWWSVPGGHVEKGETFEEAAEREASEEVPGIKIDGRMKLVFEWDIEEGDSDDPRPHRHRCQMFHGTPEGKISTGSDAGEKRWFTPEEALREKVTPPSRYIIEWFLGNGKRRAFRGSL